MSYTWGYVKEAALAKLDLTEAEANVQNLLNRFPFYANEVITQICSSIKPKYSFAKFEITKEQVSEPQQMPSDFVGFGDDVCYEIVNDKSGYGNNAVVHKELHDDDFDYYGNDKVIFKRPGTFCISYNARWFTFVKNLDNRVKLPVPHDILDCIPSYIASQCFKIDDEYKSSVYRNEYEMFLARIDDTNYKNTKTIKIDGGW